MKSKLILVSFLLLLYIGPMIFISRPSTNMSKDFVPSTEYEASDQSITSFAETLPDDVLYYPDSTSTDPLFATGGDTGYDNTYDVDSTYFQLGAYESKILEFDYSAPINYFTWAVYGYSDDSVILDYSDDGIDWSSHFETITTVGWFNGTENDVSLNDTGTFYVLFDGTGTDGSDYIDYVEIVIGFMAGSSDGYAESFADVSDWSDHSNFAHADDVISSDGDVMTKNNDWGGGTDYDYIYADGMSVDTSTGDYYFEARFKCTNLDTFTFYLRTENGEGSGSVQPIEVDESADWVTLKVIITLAVVEQVTILGIDDDGDSIQYLDYLRIGSADEMGYEHDCSSGNSITTLRAYDGYDGDHVKFEHLGGGPTGELSFAVDVGGTHVTAMDTEYYPFVGWYAVNLTDDFYCVYADGTLLYNGSGLGLQRANVVAAGEAEYTMITFTLNTLMKTMALDWVKGYSIADFTVTQSGATIEDYLYVDSGVLYSNIDSGYIETNHDPALSIVTGVNGLWTLTTSSGTPESDYYVSAWAGYSSETEGSLASGTLTDLKLKFTDDANVAAITFFIAPPQWYESGEVELLFTVPIDETGLDMLLIFLGLIMIPLSTLYLVKGGRSEMSSDKLFYGLIAFTIGWALFLGGIMA